MTINSSVWLSIQVEEELNQSEPVKKSVPTRIRHVVTKSIGLFFWPLRKSFNAIKDYYRNKISSQNKRGTKIETN